MSPMNIIDELNTYFGTEVENIHQFFDDFEDMVDEVDKYKCLKQFLESLS